MTSGSGKGVFWKRGLFRRVHYLEILENLEILQIPENPQTVENEGESDHCLEILETLEMLEIVRGSSSEKDPFQSDPFFLVPMIQAGAPAAAGRLPSGINTEILHGIQMSMFKRSGQVRPRQGTEICNFGALSPLEALHWISCFFSSIYVQFSKTRPQNLEKVAKNPVEKTRQILSRLWVSWFFRPWKGRTPRGSCNRTLLRRVLRRFFKGSAS